MDACRVLGKACSFVDDFDDVRRYYKREKEGYEDQLGRDSEKALEVTRSLTTTIGTTSERIEKYRDLLKRMERELGDENIVTLETLNNLGVKLKQNRQYE